MGVDIQISKEELLAAAGKELARLAYRDTSANGATAEEEEEGTNGKKQRRRKKKLTPSRSVSAQQILELIRAKGALRGVEIMELTGLSSGAVRARMLELKKQKAITEQREGTIVRFAASRGTGAPRKSSLKPDSGKKARKKKRTYNKRKPAAGAEASA